MYNKKIEYISYHDSLTGLYNRRFFEEELLRLNTDRKLPITLVMGDVNGHKLTNDAFGHIEGDKLLKAVASILTNSCRKEDIIARWGGDEFLILLTNTPEERAKEICETIKFKCKTINDLAVDVSISLGYAIKTTGEDSIMKTLTLAEDRLYRNKLAESKSQRSGIIETIKNSLYARNHETEEHAERLMHYSSLVGSALKLTDEELTNLSLLSMLHDIGKIGIPDHILLKPGPLTEEEWIEMKKHPVIGFRIAQSSGDLHQIASLILHHHERYDGKGYPERIASTSIPLLSRIISVVDAYDAMTSDRPYQAALTAQEAIDELKRCSGTQFDPEIVNLFVSLI